MMPSAPRPEPQPGQRWLGGTNGGHSLSVVEVVQVTKFKVRVRFLGGPYHGKLTFLYRYQFVVQYRPLEGQP